MLKIIGIIFVLLCLFRPDFIASVNKEYCDVSLIFVGLLIIYVGEVEKNFKSIKIELASLKNKKEEEK